MATVQHREESKDSSNHTDMHCTRGTNCEESATKLIINYLPHGMTQDELFKMFSTVGEVESCVLMCDKQTFDSLCYGFVEYFQPEDAANAIKFFDKFKIQNKILKVSYARPSNKAIMNANLYVRGLPKEFQNTDIEKLFSPFGKIIEHRILCDGKDNCCSKEVGFVRFDKRAEAERAIEKLNGVLLPGVVDKPLLVKFAAHSNKELYKQQAHFVIPRDQYGGHYRNVNGMSPNLQQPLLGMNPAVQYTGEPIYTKSSYNGGMNRNPQSHPSQLDYRSMQRNVQFPSADAPFIPMRATNSQVGTEMQALQKYNPMQGPPLVAESLLPGYDTKNNFGWSLFVANFPSPMNENGLLHLFAPYGVVTKVKIIRPSHLPATKYYAFVTMANYFQAVTAIHWLNGCTINNYTLRVAFQNKGGSPKN